VYVRQGGEFRQEFRRDQDAAPTGMQHTGGSRGGFPKRKVWQYVCGLGKKDQFGDGKERGENNGKKKAKNPRAHGVVDQESALGKNRARCIGGKKSKIHNPLWRDTRLLERET